MMQMLLAQSIDGYEPDLRCAQQQMALMDEDMHRQFEIEPPDYRSCDRRLRMLKVLVYRLAACFVFGTKQYGSVFNDIAKRHNGEAPAFDAEQLMYCSFMHFPTKEMIHYVWSLHLIQRQQPLHDMVARGIVEHTGLYADALLCAVDYASPNIISSPLAPLEDPSRAYKVKKALQFSETLRGRRLYSCYSATVGGDASAKSPLEATFQDVSVFYDTSTIRKTVEAVRRQAGKVMRNADARCMFVCDERTASGAAIHNSKFITSYPSLACSETAAGYARVASCLSKTSKILKRRYVDADNVLDSLVRLMHSRRVRVPSEQPSDLLRIQSSSTTDADVPTPYEQFRSDDEAIDGLFAASRAAARASPAASRFDSTSSLNDESLSFEQEWRHAYNVGEFSVIDLPHRSLCNGDKWKEETVLCIKKHIDDSGSPQHVLSVSSVFAIRTCWLAAEARLASLSNPHMRISNFNTHTDALLTYVDDNEQPCHGPAPDGMFLLCAYRAQQVAAATVWADHSKLPWVTPWPSHSGPKQLSTIDNPCNRQGPPAYIAQRASTAARSTSQFHQATLARDIACLGGMRCTTDEVAEYHKHTSGANTFDDKNGTCDPFVAASVAFLTDRGILALSQDGKSSFGMHILRELGSGQMAIEYDKKRQCERFEMHASQHNAALPTFCVNAKQGDTGSTRKKQNQNCMADGVQLYNQALESESMLSVSFSW
jgi:hypothetical protein